MRRFIADLSLSAVIAGFVAVLVGFTSSAVIVFEAARASGATTTQVGSWMWALGLGMGLTSIGLSLRYRMPVLTAWSTPGAALLTTSVVGLPLAQAVGVFMVSALLVMVVGASGLFERLLQRLPKTLGAAMLAGVLLRFGLDAFIAMRTQLLLAGAMFIAYLLARRYAARYAVIVALIIGVVIAAAKGLLGEFILPQALTQPQFVMPQFSVVATLGVALPLFVVTMASQNVPGVATLQAHGYQPPLSPVITTTGAATFVLAPFGAYSLSLAAITAALCMGPQAHPDPARRYTAAVMAGVFYVVIGLFGAAVAALFAAFPRELIMATAGLALISTISHSLSTALSSAQPEAERDAALITFLVTASGLNLVSIGSAFWGLVAGLLALLIARWRSRKN